MLNTAAAAVAQDLACDSIYSSRSPAALFSFFLTLIRNCSTVYAGLGVRVSAGDVGGEPRLAAAAAARRRVFCGARYAGHAGHAGRDGEQHAVCAGVCGGAAGAAEPDGAGDGVAARGGVQRQAAGADGGDPGVYRSDCAGCDGAAGGGRDEGRGDAVGASVGCDRRCVCTHVLACVGSAATALFWVDMKVIVDETLNILLAGRDTVCGFGMACAGFDCLVVDGVAVDVCDVLSRDASRGAVSSAAGDRGDGGTIPRAQVGVDCFLSGVCG